MNDAGIKGVHASPKGLRHSFAIAALQTGIPPTLVQKWLGHSRLTTTAIYVDIVGKEEPDMVKKLWGSFLNKEKPPRYIPEGRT